MANAAREGTYVRTNEWTDGRTNRRTDGRTARRSDRTLWMRFLSRTSSSLVPFDGLSSPGFYGYREELRSRSGRSLGTAKHRSTHFAALRLLLIIYAASAAPLPTPVVAGTRVLRRAGTIRIGIIARVPMPGQSYREPRSIRPE